MPDEDNTNKSLVRSIVEKITAVQIAVAIVSIAAFAAITWFIVDGGNVSMRQGFLSGILIFSAVIVGLAVTLIGVFYIIFGGSGEGTSLLNQITERMIQIPMTQVVAAIIGFVCVGLIAWFIIAGGDIFSAPDKARALITFAVAIVTVAIALIMVLYVVFAAGQDPEFKDRFSSGKDVLMVFVGILGTIMGFYYGTDKVSTKDIPTFQGAAQDSGAAGTKVLESKAFDILIKQNYDDASKAFDLLIKATPPSPNIKNINDIQKFLGDNQVRYNTADDTGKKAVWKELYCKISDGHMADGMPKETIDKFDSGCHQAVPTPTAQPPAASPTR